jgi:hypothetical protein
VAAVLFACSTQAPPSVTSVETIDQMALRNERYLVQPGQQMPFMGDPYPTVGSGFKQSSAGPGLAVFPAFAEGQPAAYVTTEVWQEFERVWMQPVYVAVVPEGTPAPLPVFSVNAGSAFYAPYWQVFNYTPIPGVQFTSSRDVINSGVKLTAGVGKQCSLTGNASLGTAIPQAATGPVRPLNGTPVGRTRNIQGYVDGHITHCVDFGDDQRFTWDYEDLVVEETPMYTFAREGLNQEAVPVDLPYVAGSGPLHQPRCDGQGHCSGISNGVPTFGSFWRLNTVLLPPTADVFVPPADSKLRGVVQDMGFAAAIPDQDLGPDFSLRVASNGASCLGPGKRVADCQWLDSQNAIEAQLPDFRVTESETRISAPLILFDKLALSAP